MKQQSTDALIKEKQAGVLDSNQFKSWKKLIVVFEVPRTQKNASTSPVLSRVHTCPGRVS